VKGSYREPSLITAKHGRIGAASGNQFDRRKFPRIPLSGAKPVSALPQPGSRLVSDQRPSRISLRFARMFVESARSPELGRWQ
jgi:hypothetical protein